MALNSSSASPVVPSTSIVLATLNEADNLSRLMERIQALNLPSHEVIIVDDGSIDGTIEIARRLAESDPSVRFILRPVRHTLVSAQLEGIEAARSDWIVVMDADLQHPPEALPLFLSEANPGASIVVGTRYSQGGSPGTRPVTRALISHGAEVFARTLLPHSRAVSDPMSGFFAFDRKHYRSVLDAEGRYKLLLYLLSIRGSGIVREVGYSFCERTSGESKITSDISFLPVFLAELMSVRRFSGRATQTQRRDSKGPLPVSASHHAPKSNAVLEDARAREPSS
jgi:dolichol-phosphate mannosyltransferase